MPGLYSFLPLGFGYTRGILPRFVAAESLWPVSSATSSLPYEPHTFTVETAVELVQAGTYAVLPPIYTPPVTLTGQITPKRFESVFEATGLQLRRPHKLLVGLGVEHLFIVGSRVTYNGRRFKVATMPEVKDATGVVDHLSIYLDEIQFGAEATVDNRTPQGLSLLPIGIGVNPGLLPIGVMGEE